MLWLLRNWYGEYYLLMFEMKIKLQLVCENVNDILICVGGFFWQNVGSCESQLDGLVSGKEWQEISWNFWECAQNPESNGEENHLD